MATQMRLFLAEIAARLEQDRLTQEDRVYLSECLRGMAEGEPPQKVFKTAKKKGATPERDAQIIRNNSAITCIAALIRPKYQSEEDFSPSMPSGEGMTEIEAIALVADISGIEQSNLERYWNEAKRQSPELHESHFKLRHLYPK